MTYLWGRGPADRTGRRTGRRPAHRRAHGPEECAARRGAYREVLRAVVEEANRRCDGVLPTDLPGVGEVFEDELALVGALQLRWHTRLAGAVEQAVEAEPGDPESAVVTGWRRTAQALPGVRAVLDARAEHPGSEQERAALRTAESKDRALLAAMAGLAAPTDPGAAGVGLRLELRARERLHVAA